MKDLDFFQLEMIHLQNIDIRMIVHHFRPLLGRLFGYGCMCWVQMDTNVQHMSVRSVSTKPKHTTQESIRVDQPPGQRPIPPGQIPPCGQTGVKTLPSPKLRLKAVIRKPSGLWKSVIHNIVTLFVIPNVIYKAKLWPFIIYNSLIVTFCRS